MPPLSYLYFISVNEVVLMNFISVNQEIARDHLWMRFIYLLRKQNEHLAVMSGNHFSEF